MFTPYLSLDGLRAFVVLLLAFSQCVMAFWPDLRRWPDTTTTRSAALDTPVVPVGPTFAIWGVIFAGCIAFGVWQALPSSFDHPMARQIGWLAALVFAANTAWEYIVPKFGLGWLSVMLAVLEFLGLGFILIFLAWGSWGLSPTEWWLVAAPFHLFAGWVTAAVMVNLSSVLEAKGIAVGPVGSICLLLAVGGVAVAITSTTGAIIYALAVAWALGGIALAAWRLPARRVVLGTALVLIGVLGFTAVNAPQAARAPDGLSQGEASRTQFVETSDMVIHYRAWGPEDGPVIIAFHGWPDDASSWDAVARRLADQGYRVYAPYLRGFGETRFRNTKAIRTGQLAALVKDGFAFADALGVKTYSLIGHDWGGRIVQSMSVLQPDRVERLISLSGYSISYSVAPPPPLTFIPQLWYQFALNLPVGEANLRNDPNGFLYAIWARWTPNWDKTLREKAFRAAWPSWQNPDFIPVTMTAYSYSARGYDPALATLEKRLADGPQVPVPTVIIQGADDPLERPEITASHDARMFVGGLVRHVIPATGHWPHRETPEEVVRIFLESSKTKTSR